MHWVVRIFVAGIIWSGAFSTAQADYASARSWFQSLTLEDRLMVQFALMFTDDYMALADGAFGRRTYQALVHFQSRNRLPPTGVLTTGQFDLLFSQMAGLYEIVGFEFKQDPSSGLTIGVPTALVPETSSTARGTRWAASDGSVEVETVRIPTSEVPYLDLYSRLRTAKPTRTITYETLKDDFFVISGVNRGKLFYSRYQRTPTDTRGFSLAWAPEHDVVFSRLSIAMSNSLVVNAARMPATASPPALGSPSATAAPTPAPPEKNRSSGSGSGFFVTVDGQLITNAHVVEGCKRLAVGGHGPAQLLRLDKSNDLALLKVSGSVTPLSLRREPVRLGEDVVALGYPFGEMMANSLTVTSGNVNSLNGIGGDSRDLQISAQVQPGNSGGPLFDRHGAVVGVVSSRLDDVKTLEVSGALPQNVNFALKVSMLDGFLQSADVRPVYASGTGPERSIADIAEIGRSSTVQVLCN